MEARPKPLILVVERDPHVRELEAHFLERAGYRAEFASDGQTALEKTRELSPDVVVTEILLPGGLDGLALCRAIKSDEATRHISVLIFSILSAKTRAREAGATAFMHKPLAELPLIEMMKRMLDQAAAAPTPTGPLAS